MRSRNVDTPFLSKAFASSCARAVYILVFILTSIGIVSPSTFFAESNFHEYDQASGDTKLTGRVYHTANGKVVVEAWPHPRKLNLKVNKITLVSPSGKTYRVTDIESVPKSQLPKRRSRYLHKPHSWLKDLFQSYAYASCGSCGTGEETPATEKQRDDSSAQAAFGILMGMSEGAEKEWVSIGEFSVDEEPGQWKALVDIVDQKTQSHRFTIPFKLSDISTTPKEPAPQAKGKVGEVSWTDEETGLTTTIRLNPDGSRTKTAVDRSGRVISSETRPPVIGVTRTFLDADTGLRITETENPDGSVTRRAEDEHGNWSEGHYYPEGRRREAVPQAPPTETPPSPTPEEKPPAEKPPTEPSAPSKPPGTTVPRGPERPEISVPTITTFGVTQPSTHIRLGIDITKCPYPWLPRKENTVRFTAKIYKWVGGQWVYPGPPRIITFTLRDVSNEKGICMNKGDETTPDLYFKDPIPGFILSGGEGGFYNTARTKEPVTEATVTVTSDDYGSFGWIKSSAPDCEDIPPNGPVSIPLDDNTNTIADSAPQDDNGNSPETDYDAVPVLDGYNGDGYTNYEEYRGFFVQGSHTRTDISLKDLLINDRTGMGLGHYPTSNITCHLVANNELKDREGNFNRGHATTGAQHGLIMRMDAGGELGEGVGGRSVQISSGQMGPPGNVSAVIFATWNARRAAHELGHSTCVWHHGEAPWALTWIYAPEDSALYNNRASSWVRRKWRTAWGDPPLTLCGKTLPAEFRFHPKGAQQSGDVNCVMKYVGFFEIYSDNGMFGCWPADASGTTFCSSPNGTGYNAGGLVGGNATKGSCRGQLRVNDK